MGSVTHPAASEESSKGRWNQGLIWLILSNSELLNAQKASPVNTVYLT